MRVFFVFIYSFTTFLTLTCSSQSNPNLRLVVTPLGHFAGDNGPPVIVQRVHDVLNLTCRLVNDKYETLPDYNITWNWQYSTSSNANRVMMVSMSHNAANLVFKSLKETDTGEYTCKCLELDLYQNVKLKVKGFKRSCNELMFACTNGNCIAKHYMCDGKVDCKGGVDESFENCGANPCDGKIPCDDGRCIPESWCCDQMHDPNCTTKHKPKCCQRSDLMSLDAGHWENSNRYGDLGFLQTTIYTVIGCAMAFMFIVTILVIAICRVHLKRTVISRCPLNHQHHHLRPGSPLRPGGLPLYDIDMFLDHRHQESHSGGLLVTYNINNGVQFVGRPIDPPPYCEIVDTPPREGPPPPYVSRENITQDATPQITNEENQSANQEEEPPKAVNESDTSINNTEVRFTPVPNEVVSNLKGLTSKSRTTKLINETNNVTHSMGDVSKFNQENSSTSYDFCSSVPSVSGLSKIKNKNIKRNVLTDFSDSESDSSCMENDTLLNANLRKNCDHSDDFRSKSAVLTNENSSNSFINNIAAVSKSLIGSLGKKTNTETELKSVKNRAVPNSNRKPFKPLLTQKSFDSSEHTRKDLVLTGSNTNNVDKIVPNVTHSLGDLSPVSNDINFGDFTERRDFLTLPLRESFIGVRNEEN